MSDPFKSITTVAEAKQKYVLADRAARLMAKHCDRRIAAARKAASKEEKYLLRLLHSKSNGPVMQGDIEGAFHRIREALDRNPFNGK